MAFKRQYGSDRVVREDEDATPQQKKFEAATGKSSDSAVGDVPQKESAVREDDKAQEQSAAKASNVPSGVNKEIWAEAERSALGQAGGWSGSTKEGRKIAIQEKYDQMIENDKQLKKGFSAILGDV